MDAIFLKLADGANFFVAAGMVLIFWRVHRIELQLNNGISKAVSRIESRLATLVGTCNEREKRISIVEDKFKKL